MCGILGLCAFHKKPIDLKNFHRSTSAIHHRGPDDEGYLFMNLDEGQIVRCKGGDSDPDLDLPDITSCYERSFSLAFGFRRLSILDLSVSGHQPMSSEDGKYWIVFNGEIYNYVELREELNKIGYEFTSASDTEVLLAGYREWGSDLLNRLIGMFAFVILDLNRRIIFLARDFFGIKPLYYTLKNDRLAFASEAKTLLEMEQVERTVDPTAAYLYLRHGLTDHDESTLWRDIRKLPPAHFWEVLLDEPCTTKPRQYWCLELDRHLNISFSDAAAQLRDMFLQNVRLHLRSDVAVGAALSGGIDSSAIVAAMRRIQGADRNLHTFSYLADDPVLSEEKWADLANQSVNATVHKTIFSADNLVEDIDSLIYALDEPFGSTSIYAQYCVFRLAHQNRIKVMLDGQGADEMLGGYASYLSGSLISLFSRGSFAQGFSFLRRIWNRPDAGGAKVILRAGGLLVPEVFQGIGHKLVGANLMPAWMNGAWFAKHDVKPRSLTSPVGPDNRHAMRSLLFQTFTTTSLPMLLRYEDRNSMAHSIESRVPFLTPEIVSFIFSLPEQYIIDTNGVTKSVFRQAMLGIVPDSILERRDKIGFQTPEKRLLTILKPWVEKILNSPRARELPAMNMEHAKQDFYEMLAGKRSFDFRIWRWINFVRWAEIFNVTF
jgi:asparagine synthase (glutamine-hydrolysing)